MLFRTFRRFYLGESRLLDESVSVYTHKITSRASAGASFPAFVNPISNQVLTCSPWHGCTAAALRARVRVIGLWLKNLHLFRYVDFCDKNSSCPFSLRLDWDFIVRTQETSFVTWHSDTRERLDTLYKSAIGWIIKPASWGAMLIGWQWSRDCLIRQWGASVQLFEYSPSRNFLNIALQNNMPLSHYTLTPDKALLNTRLC